MKYNERENIDKQAAGTGISSKIEQWLKPVEDSERQRSLYLINTRLWLSNLSNRYERQITIDTVPENEWQNLFEKYDAFWFMGIYKPSQFARDHAKEWSFQYTQALPDLDADKDIGGSPFAIPDYSPNPVVARSWREWDKMVEKLHTAGKKVYIDFVPNHTAVDHPWAKAHPDYYVSGSEADYQSNPALFVRIDADDGKTYYLAHGKDPNYPQWADNLQLNYANPDTQAAMEEQLLRLTDHCDGVRCDVAMLINAGTFTADNSWGKYLSDEQKRYIRDNPFWKRAIAKAKEKAREKGKAGFDFIAEAYWDKEELGADFDFMYRDELYKQLERIANGETAEYLREHIKYLLAARDSGRHYRDVVYTENHDEPRAVSKLGERFSVAAIAAIGFLPETLLMVHGGQEEGKEIRPPAQIIRMPKETPKAGIQHFYDEILNLKRSILFEKGIWEPADAESLGPEMVALKVSLEEAGLGAVICINLGHNFACCRIREIKAGDSAEVHSLSRGVALNIDQKREGGMFMGLEGGETQVVYYELGAPSSLRVNLEALACTPDKVE